MTLADFKDEKGFIGHKNDRGEWDFGDSAQRTFTEILCKDLSDESALDFIDKIISISKGEQYARHWDESEWWGQLWTMSRDNFKPIMWAGTYHGYQLECDSLKKRKYFAWNWKRIWPEPDAEPKIPDWILPTIVWGAEIRARRASRFGDITILMLCDLVDFISTCVLVVKSWFKPNETSSDLNQINEHIFKCKTVGTPFSWLARKVYSKFRARTALPPIGTQMVVWTGHRIKDVLRVYYHNPKLHPPMWEVLDPMIDKYMP